MEDRDGLDLSLGLSWNKSSPKSNETRTDDREQSDKLINEFKSFLEGGTQLPNPVIAPQTFGQLKLDGIYCGIISNPAAIGSSSKTFNSPETCNNSPVIDCGGRAGACNKRKSLIDEFGSKKKHEKEARMIDSCDKFKSLLFSGAGDDESFAVTEDVADSEAEISTILPNCLVVSSNSLNGGMGKSISPYMSHGMMPAGLTTWPPLLASHSQAVYSHKLICQTASQDERKVDGVEERSLFSMFPAITPGMAAELKFGGSGSYPDLPWVSTRGLGQNGRTISGVTYRFNVTQIKIVCACHGSHMLPEEFIRHADEERESTTSVSALGSLRDTDTTVASAHN